MAGAGRSANSSASGPPWALIHTARIASPRAPARGRRESPGLERGLPLFLERSHAFLRVLAHEELLLQLAFEAQSPLEGHLGPALARALDASYGARGAIR